MTTATANPVKAHTMKRFFKQGVWTHHESAQFVEYDNGTVYVSQPNWDNGYFSKDEARAIAANLQKQGFKFI